MRYALICRQGNTGNQKYHLACSNSFTKEVVGEIETGYLRERNKAQSDGRQCSQHLDGGRQRIGSSRSRCGFKANVGYARLCLSKTCEECIYVSQPLPRNIFQVFQSDAHPSLSAISMWLQSGSACLLYPVQPTCNLLVPWLAYSSLFGSGGVGHVLPLTSLFPSAVFTSTWRWSKWRLWACPVLCCGRVLCLCCGLLLAASDRISDCADEGCSVVF